MPDYFDYEDSEYDVPTRADYEKWEEEAWREEYENATDEEREKMRNNIPY